jgi:hypothetical protein
MTDKRTPEKADDIRRARTKRKKRGRKMTGKTPKKKGMKNDGRDMNGCK